MESWSGCVISSKLIWSEGARVSPDSLMSDSQKISMKNVLHLLSADTNPIYRRYEVTLCLHMAWTASPRSTLTEIKTRTCCPHSAISYSCLCGVCYDKTFTGNFWIKEGAHFPLTHENVNSQTIRWSPTQFKILWEWQLQPHLFCMTSNLWRLITAIIIYCCFYYAHRNSRFSTA